MDASLYWVVTLTVLVAVTAWIGVRALRSGAGPTGSPTGDAGPPEVEPPPPLPEFRYHPDPVATGSVVASTAACESCGRRRGYALTSTIYAEEEVETVCPWCVADGTAAAKFDGEFNDSAGVGGYGRWDAVPPDVVREVSERTPGFMGRQQERWWTHCGDAGEFLGRAGTEDVERHSAQASIREELGLDDGPEWSRYLASLDSDGQPTAYLFRCRVCGAVGGYSDCT